MSVLVYVGGINRSGWFDKRTIAIEDNFGARGMTARATITVDTTAASPPSRPLAGQILRIVIDGTEEFEGPIVTVTDRLRNPDVYEAEVAAVDYTLWLDRKLVSAKIARPSELAGDRVKFFLAKFCPDIAEGTINDGDTAPSQSYDYVEMSAILDELAEASGYTWWVDSDKKLYFVPEVTEVAPLAAIDLDTELDIGDAVIAEDWSDLHNVLILKDFKLYSEEYYSHTKKADGVQTFFGLPYEPWSVESTQVRTTTVEGTTRNWTVVEDESITAGETDFIGEEGKVYLCISNWGVRFGHVDPPEEDEIVYVDYAYTLLDQVIIEEDAASIAEMASRTGTDGRFEKMLSSPNMRVANEDDARHYCQMLLARGSWPVVRGSFTTYLSGWKSGQTFTVISTKRSIGDVQNPGNPVRVWVQGVTKEIAVLADGESIRLRTVVEFSNKPFTAQMSLEEFLKALIDRQDRSQPVGNVTITTTSTTTTSTSTTTTTGTTTSTTTTLRARAILLESATLDYTTSTSTSTISGTSTSTTISGTSTSTSTTTTLAPAWTSPASVITCCGESTGPVEDFIDGDTGTYWSHNVNHRHEVILDMGVSRTVEDVRLYCYNLGASQWIDVEVYLSDDFVHWYYVALVSFADGAFGAEWVEDNIWSPRKARYVKLTDILTLTGYLLGAEFEAYLTG